VRIGQQELQGTWRDRMHLPLSLVLRVCSSNCCSQLGDAVQAERAVVHNRWRRWAQGRGAVRAKEGVRIVKAITERRLQERNS
jgi:hypothetical protein